MFAITPEALAVVRTVTAHVKLGPDSGLRLARRDDPDALVEVEAVPGPVPGDSVLIEKGGRIWLGPGMDERVEGCELDAATDPDGVVHFTLRCA